jgi:hypothetical protein
VGAYIHAHTHMVAGAHVRTQGEYVGAYIHAHTHMVAGAHVRTRRVRGCVRTCTYTHGSWCTHSMGVQWRSIVETTYGTRTSLSQLSHFTQGIRQMRTYNIFQSKR